jgi:hypothetical protein
VALVNNFEQFREDWQLIDIQQKAHFKSQKFVPDSSGLKQRSAKD